MASCRLDPETHRVHVPSSSTRWILYAALNLAFSALVLVGASVGGGSLGEYPYVALLFAICTSPLPLIDRLNGPFAMLGVAMAVYFVEFGALDAVSMIKPPVGGAAVGHSVDRAEVTLWLGAVAHIAGFLLAARITTRAADSSVPNDWPRSILLPVGLLLWGGALLAALYHGLVVQTENTALSVQQGLTRLGIWRATGLILIENYAGPMGVMIVAYWWAVWGRRIGGPLILLICLVQFAVGWVVDTKETAISAPVVALLTRFIVAGRLPARWLIGSVVAIALLFPIMTAKRVVMTEELHLNRLEALPRTLEILSRTLQEGEALRSGRYEQRTETFIERESVKGNVQLIVEGTAEGHPYKLGATFEPLLYVLFPRVLWSDKPGGNSAQLLNREFHISADPDTFISPSHLGEWYWNFGVWGVILGMGAAGVLLGHVAVRFDPSVQTSVTRVLVIIVTTYLLVARSEGQVEIQYALWIRSMVLIGVLHWLLARPSPRGAGAPSLAREAASVADTPPPRARFPNLLR